MSSRLLQEFKKLQRDETSVVDEVCLFPHDNVCCWRMKMRDFVEDTSDAQLLREDLAELKRRFGGDGKIHITLEIPAKPPPAVLGRVGRVALEQIRIRPQLR